MGIRLIRFVICIFLTLLFPCISAFCIDPSPFGINGLGMMHGFRDPDWNYTQKKADAMKAAGIFWDRGEMWWGTLETEKDKYDWSYFDKMAEFYKKSAINPLIILCYKSAWSNTPPSDDSERARYAKYVYEVVNRYKDTIKVWEIWNEPNIPSFWETPNVRDYTLMLEDAYKTAKKADPDCVILAAATSGPDLTYIKGIHDNGGWDFCDGISIHPYSMAGPPIPQRLDKILRIINGYIKGTGKPKLLWITEMGWTADRPREDRDQAVALFQSYVISMANGVDKLFWFCFNDWSEKWGIVRNCDPFQPKLAYQTYKLMTETFASPGPAAKFQGHLKTSQGTAGYAFRKTTGEYILVFWSDDSFKTVQVPKGDVITAIDIFGRPVRINDGRLCVGETPVMVLGVKAEDVGEVSLSFNPYLEPKGKNLIVNSSMNVKAGRDISGWNPGRFHSRDNDATYSTSTEGRSSSTCVSISKSGGYAAWDNQPIPVFPGSKFRMTGWIRTKDATGENALSLMWYSGNMWTPMGDARTKTVTGTSDWTEVSVKGTVPEDAMFLRPNLIGENNSGTVWFDDVTVVEE